MEIKLGTLKDKGDDLVAFLEPRVGTKPSLSGDTIEIEDGSLKAGVRPRHVKTYIKRFMFMKGVRKDYRVFVAGKELTIQELEKTEEEEKEEAEKAAPKEEAKPEAEEASEEKKDEEAPKEEKPKKAPAKKRASKKKAEAES